MNLNATLLYLNLRSISVVGFERAVVHTNLQTPPWHGYRCVKCFEWVYNRHRLPVSTVFALSLEGALENPL